MIDLKGEGVDVRACGGSNLIVARRFGRLALQSNSLAVAGKPVWQITPFPASPAYPSQQSYLISLKAANPSLWFGKYFLLDIQENNSLPRENYI